MTFKPSIQQQNLFTAVQDANRGSIIVDAKAGSGKTTSVIEATRYMNGSIFLGAYNAKMAKELKERCAGMGNVKAATFHSAGYQALRRAFPRVGSPDDKKVPNIIAAYMNEKGRADLADVARPLAEIVSMAKQRGIGALPQFPNEAPIWLDMIDHFALDQNLPDDYDVASLVPLAQEILRRSNDQTFIIDFDDMVYLPLKLNLRMWANDWVLIDEAQDTNPTRRALARKMLKRGGRLIAVGDPNQAIYGFSGADNDALDQIRRDFDAETLPLSVTYRCPKTVVDLARQYVAGIEAHEDNADGQVVPLDYKDLVAQVRPGDAILCRYNKYLVNLAFKLIRYGIPARIEGRAIGAGLVALASKWKVKDLDSLRGRVEGWMKRECKKAKDKGDDTKAMQIEDRGETLIVLIERAEENGIHNVAGLRKMIEDLFDDRVVQQKDMVTLCSVHRSKGLEWKRVFLLGREELMGRECRQYWQTQQEQNLVYVGITRAQDTLYDVYNVKEDRK